jgi:hypothetical protein
MYNKYNEQSGKGKISSLIKLLINFKVINKTNTVGKT